MGAQVRRGPRGREGRPVRDEQRGSDEGQSGGDEGLHPPDRRGEEDPLRGGRCPGLHRHGALHIMRVLLQSVPGGHRDLRNVLRAEPVHPLREHGEGHEGDVLGGRRPGEEARRRMHRMRDVRGGVPPAHTDKEGAPEGRRDLRAPTGGGGPAPPLRISCSPA